MAGSIGQRTGTAVRTDSNALYVDYVQRDIFVWSNRYDTATLGNSSGSDLTLSAGTVIGRITSSGNVAAVNSSSTDGSQNAIGVLATDITLADGATTTITYCFSGDVVEARLVLVNNSDSLTTNIGGTTVRDRLQGGGAQIKLVDARELTRHDN